MIKQINKEEAKKYLNKTFPQYKITDDPFERYLGYFEGNLIGIITYSIIYERAEINYVCVNKEKQNCGIGSKLLETALGIMEDHGCNIVSLEVNENNIQARKLYEKFHFQTEAVRKKYYEGEDGLLLVRKLGD